MMYMKHAIFKWGGGGRKTANSTASWPYTQPKIARGAVRGPEGHPADDDELASEKGHLLAKRARFSTITGGGSCPPPAIGTALCMHVPVGYRQCSK